MVERSAESRLTGILRASSDPTRRAILTLLAQHGPTRVTDLARHFDTSLNAVSKHIKVLEGAGLVTRRTQWREHLIEARMEALALVDGWFRDLRSIWELRLEALETLIGKENAMSDLSLTVRRTIKAPAERVFDAWLNPKMMAQFLSPRPDMTVREARSDARVGGRFFVAMLEGEKEYPHEGTYKEIVPHSRLVFTWEAPWSAPETYVEILFSPVAEGTEVVLTHVRFTSEESRDGHQLGWIGILGKLETLAAT